MTAFKTKETTSPSVNGTSSGRIAASLAATLATIIVEKIDAPSQARPLTSIGAKLKVKIDLEPPLEITTLIHVP